MFKKAQAIDPYVLMTLKSMDVLNFTLTEAGGGPQEHVLTEIHFKDRRQRAIETAAKPARASSITCWSMSRWNGTARRVRPGAPPPRN